MIDLVRRVPPGRPAIVDAATREELTYGALLERAGSAAAMLREAAGGRAAIFLVANQDVGAVVLYLAALTADLPVALLEPQPAALGQLAQAYAPALLVLPTPLAPPPGYVQCGEPDPGYVLWRTASRAERAPHAELALLLSTSGSTGSPKLVRLAARNLAANALSIAEYLEIGPEERAIASLPLNYSYGLSVLNSHLAVGAALVLVPHSFVRPEFWAAVDEHRCTSFAGVPFMYETLHRLRLDPRRHPTLRTFTQAGGALRPELIRHFCDLTRAAGARLFVMYGQTEASPRMAYVPPEELPRKIGSIGIAIPRGHMHLEPVAGMNGAREIVYEGPNVMMGYAEGPADLELPDTQDGTLRTGDLGNEDADGYFFVTGRLKRFAKLFGRRVNLEDVERALEERFGPAVAAFDGGDRIVVATGADGEVHVDAMRAHVAHVLAVPPSAVEVRAFAALPRSPSGKKNYRAIEAML